VVTRAAPVAKSKSKLNGAGHHKAALPKQAPAKVEPVREDGDGEWSEF
jgi:hypothetical protein